ncbi:hypothetical protein [Nocardia sp. NPDC050175]|uniref:hypothetical protein n=1 Tax=Nocardia sp. NPDC050175 TaxID=3364317 RepID=UPI00378CB7D2
MVAALGLAAGCGAETHSDSAPPAPATSASVAPAHAESKTETTADPADYQSGYGTTFKSPSGQFRCSIVDGHAGCNGQFPPNVPLVRDCAGRLSEPNTISVSRGNEGGFVQSCSPTAAADSKILPYNVVLRIAQTQCVIHEQTGVSCETGDGHGFTVSDNAYTLK